MDVQQILKDPEFHALPEEERIKVLDTVDSDFKALPQEEKIRVFSIIKPSQPQADTPQEIATEEQTGAQVGPVPPNAQSTITQGTVGEIPITKSETLTSAIKNTPESAKNLAAGFAQMIAHPIDTAKDVGELALGVISLAVPGEQNGEEKAVQLGEYLKNRFGGVEEIRNTFATDPVGFAFDIMSATSGTGTLLKASSKTAGIGEAMQKVGAIADPVSIAAKGVELGAKMISKSKPSDLYQSAVKFSTVMKNEERTRITNAALDNGIMPTLRGIEKVDDKINSLNLEIAELIDEATKTGAKIPVDNLFRQFDDLKDPDTLGALAPNAIKSIDNVKKQLLKTNRDLGRTEYTPSQMQELKKSIYKDLEDVYESNKTPRASKKAQMAVAKAAKESIEEIIPEVKLLNAEDGTLIELKKALERASNRITNHDFISIRTGITATAGGSIGGWPAAIAGMAAGLFDHPIVKAKAAIVLHKLQKKGIEISPDSLAARLGLLEAANIAQNSEEAE